ncbi:MAG: hypothetical protein ACE5IR_20230 [bacterium]
MGATKRIPVIKPQVVISKKNRRSKLFLFTAFITGLALLLFHVWLRVQINTALTEIRQLQEENDKIAVEIDALNVKVIKLSDYGRIYKLAEEQLGLVFVHDENKFQVQ